MSVVPSGAQRAQRATNATGSAIPANRFVAANGGTDVVLSDGTNGMIGITAFEIPASGDVLGAVRHEWGAEQDIESGAAFSDGDPVTSDGTGRAITAVGAGTRVYGRAKGAAGAAGEVVKIHFTPGVEII